MERIDLEQGSLAWKLYRMEHHNASEAGALMGVAPAWMQMNTPYKLWQFKQGEFEVKENGFMRHGTRNEPVARAKLSHTLLQAFEDAVFEDGIYSASLDGYSVDAAGTTTKVEIKCPAAGKKSESWKFAVNGEIPPHYYWQIIHQEMVCPTDVTFFAVYDADSCELIILDMDEAMAGWRDDVPKLREAWESFIETPPEPDWEEKSSGEWLRAEVAFEAAKTALADAEELVKQTKQDLIDLTVTERARGAIVEVSKRQRKGAIQYKQVPELDGVVLEKYRGKSSSFWDVRLRK